MDFFISDCHIGHKYLIRGNHELAHDKIVQYFEEIVNYKELNTNNSKIILSHYPIAHWNGQYRGIVHLYGHIHNNTKDSQMMLTYKKMAKLMEIPHNAYNVGCMMPYMDYTPQTLENIISKGETYYNQMTAEKTIQELMKKPTLF